MTDIVLEGFFDYRPTDDDCFLAVLMSPVVQIWFPSSLDISSEIEDIGVDITVGDIEEIKKTLFDESQDGNLDLTYLRRTFTRAKNDYKKGKKSNFLYWKIMLEISPQDENFKIILYEGDSDLNPTLALS